MNRRSSWSRNFLLRRPKLRLTITVMKFIVIVCVPLLLIILPANFFDNGQSICLSILFFDQECYACGLTRGIMHLIHFQFEDAWDYNMLSFIVLPLLIVIWFEQLNRERKVLRSLLPVTTVQKDQVTVDERLQNKIEM